MHSAACQNQIEIRPAGRCIKRSKRHVLAKDAGSAPAVAGMLSPTRQPRAKAPAKPVTPGQRGPGTHRCCHAHAGQAHLYRPGRVQAAIDRQQSCGNAAELAPDRCGQPKIANPDPPRAAFVTGAHEGQC